MRRYLRILFLLLIISTGIVGCRSDMFDNKIDMQELPPPDEDGRSRGGMI